MKRRRGTSHLGIVAMLGSASLTAPVAAISPATPLTDPSLRPWAATVIENFEHRCSASLIDPHWVLTARHCVKSFCGQDQLTQLRVSVVGTRVDFPALRVVCWNTGQPQAGVQAPDDVALILIQYARVAEELLPTISRAGQALPGSGRAAAPLLAVGWSNGNAQAARSEPHMLKLVPLPRAEGSALLARPGVCERGLALGRGQFAGRAPQPEPSGFYGLSEGDSGGPLMRVRSGRRPEIVGVTSAACEATGVSVFEGTTRFHGWIVDNVCGFYQWSRENRRACLLRFGGR